MSLRLELLTPAASSPGLKAHWPLLADALHPRTFIACRTQEILNRRSLSHVHATLHHYSLRVQDQGDALDAVVRSRRRTTPSHGCRTMAVQSAQSAVSTPVHAQVLSDSRTPWLVHYSRASQLWSTKKSEQASASTPHVCTCTHRYQQS